MQLTNQVKNSDYYQYFSVLIAPEEMRDKMLAIYAFAAEIRKIPYLITEPMAGHIRLQWWRDGVDEMYSGKITKHRHEISEALLPMVSKNAKSKDLLHKIINATELDIDKVVPANIAELEQYCADISSSVFELLLIANEQCSDEALKFTFHMGIAYELVNLMRNVRHSAFHGHIFLPDDTLKAQELTAEDIIEGKGIGQAGSIVAQICKLVESHLQKASELAKKLSKKQIKILAPYKIIKPYLKKIAKNNFDIFNNDIEVMRFYLQLKILL